MATIPYYHPDKYDYTGIVSGLEMEGTAGCDKLADAIQTLLRERKNLRSVLQRLYDEYVVDMHGDDACDCDPSVGIDTCGPCEARALLNIEPKYPPEGTIEHFDRYIAGDR